MKFAPWLVRPAVRRRAEQIRVLAPSQAQASTEGEMKRWFQASAVALTAVVAGCATGTLPIADQYRAANVAASIRKVAVVSVLGPDLRGSYQGLTIFNNAASLTSVPDWGINDVARKSLEERLKAAGRYEVVSLSYDQADLWSRYVKARETYWTRVRQAQGADQTESIYKDVLPTFKQAVPDLDAVLMIFPGHEAGSCREGPACKQYGDTGYGLFVFSPVGITATSAYVSTKVVLVDMDPIASVVTTWAGGEKRLEGIGWQDDFEKYPPDQRQTVRDAIVALVKDAFGTTLASLRLA